MEINNDLLEHIERLAAAAYSPQQIATMLGYEPEEFDTYMKDKDSDISISYYKGLNDSEYAVRKSIFTLAINGSSPAQTLATKILERNEIALLKSGYTPNN